MPTVKTGLLISLSICLAVFAACSGTSDQRSNSQANAANRTAENSTSPKTNVEELGMLINVPYTSDEVFWKDDPSHKTITAVLRFTDAENGRVIADAEKFGPAQQAEITSQPWFPPELVAQSDLNGDDRLNGQSYPANAFFQDPYNQGRVIKINDTDYFILQLSAK